MGAFDDLIAPLPGFVAVLYDRCFDEDDDREPIAVDPLGDGMVGR